MDPRTAPTGDVRWTRDPSTTLGALRSRAAGLRLTATGIRTPLSTTYRRRAAELELQAAALAAALGFAERPLCICNPAAA